MKKWFVVLAVLLLMILAVSAAAEVDHSMINVEDEHFYCWLQMKEHQFYFANYSCLMTNTDMSRGMTIWLYISLTDAEGKEIYKTDEHVFLIKPGETRAIYIRDTIKPEVRNQVTKCKLIWANCENESYAGRAKLYTPLPVYDLKVGGGSGQMWCKGYFDNPFDAKIDSDWIFEQIELYDRNDGHLVYCGEIWQGDYEIKPLKKGVMLEGTSPIPDMIGTDYDVKVRLEYYGTPQE